MVDPTLNEVVPFQTLTGVFKLDHSDWGGMTIVPTQPILQKIIYTPETSMFNGDPAHLEDALDRMGRAIVSNRAFIKKLVDDGVIPGSLPSDWGADEEIP